MIIKCRCDDVGPERCPVYKAFGVVHQAGEDHYEDGFPVIRRGDATSDHDGPVDLEALDDSAGSAQLCDTCTHSPVCVVASAVRTLDRIPVISACGLRTEAVETVDEGT